MKFKILFIFTFSLIFSGLPLFCNTQQLLDTKLMAVIEQGNLEEVKSLLLQGANANTVSLPLEYTALMIAAAYGFDEIIKVLLEFGAEINAMSNEDESALAFASRNGQVETVKLLLEMGADLHLNGDVALFCALYEGQIDVVKLLLDKGADANAFNPYLYAKIPLLITAIEGASYFCLSNADEIKTKIVKLLLEHGADVNAKGDCGDTALIEAVKNGSFEIVKLLLKFEADINTPEKYIKGTALKYAISKKHWPIVNILLNYGADINITVEDDSSCLKYITKKQDPQLIELFLMHINHILDKTNDPKIWQHWDRYILDASKEIWCLGGYTIKLLNAFRMLLHHADKLPLSRKRLESVTAKTLGHYYYGERSFRETVKHLRKNAF